MWPDDIEVVHVYLTADVLARACRDMYDRYVSDVSLRDEVQADDPAIHRTALMLAQEAALGGPGCGLLVDALAGQLAVLLVRGHADVVFDEPAGAGLTSAQERAVRDHVEEHLHERITLDDLGDRRGTEPLPVPAAVPAVDRDEPARLRARPAGGARAGARAPDGNAGSAPAAEAPGRGLRRPPTWSERGVG